MGDVNREIALHMLRQAVLEREYTPLTGFPGLYNCELCAGVVEMSRRQGHSDWHDKVHGNLVALQQMFEGTLVNDGGE